MAQTVMMRRPPIRRTLANSRSAPTLRSVVAKWWTTATERTASKLSSLNGRDRLSHCSTWRQVTETRCNERIYRSRGCWALRPKDSLGPVSARQYHYNVFVNRMSVLE
ncbi:hypothetical protein L798_11351 [Zootermopsis nevadensis]|uniref:Uncharacterized protein n=1 Tax=Zootermopsis nevadensis TaxID=136037 RepID=A0A067RIZ6_ZOONE|nr:hypothetical protein L798_11351 [Zootermopsis nevadensis]